MVVQTAARITLHFAPLGEEARMAATTELMQLNRLPHETIDALLPRFMLLRHSAVQQGGRNGRELGRPFLAPAQNVWRQQQPTAERSCSRTTARQEPRP